MAVLRIRMVTRVMFCRLQDARVLQKGDDVAVFLAGAVRPLVKLIGIGTQKREQPDLPRQPIQLPGNEQRDRRQQNQIPRALPPAVARHKTREVVVHRIRPADEPANQRRVIAHIGVFEPMDKAGHQLRGKNGSGKFQC